MSPLRVSLLGLALSAITGCAPATTRITVHSSPRTNDGAPMYLMVRSWDGKPTFGERYQEVAAKTFLDPPDPTVLATRPIVPGADKTTVTIDAEANKEIILYFFFTTPGPGWQTPVRRPLPAEIDVFLGRHDVDRVNMRPR